MDGGASRLRLGLISLGDPENIRTYSGVPYFALSALRRRNDLEAVPIDIGDLTTSKVTSAINRVSECLFGVKLRAFEPDRFYRKSAGRAGDLIDRAGCDAVLCMNVDPLIGKLETLRPVLHSSDATIDVISDYYPRFQNLCRPARKRADALTRAALQRANAVTYPSHWAARSAQDTYGVPRERIRVVPYGANLLKVPNATSTVEARASRKDDVCRLLFIGREWERKGGPLMIEALEILRSRGRKAAATIVGCKPDIEDKDVVVHSFLDKSQPDQNALYEALWRSASFLVMPSQQETFGAIYAEAAAQAMPAIALDTGGVSDAVAHGVSGQLLPMGATGEDIADTLCDFWPSTDAYTALCIGARTRYETVLNWDSWAAEMSALAHQVVDSTDRRV